MTLLTRAGSGIRDWNFAKKFTSHVDVGGATFKITPLRSTENLVASAEQRGGYCQSAEIGPSLGARAWVRNRRRARWAIMPPSHRSAWKWYCQPYLVTTLTVGSARRRGSWWPQLCSRSRHA